MYQARVSGFQDDLTAAEGDGLSVGADLSTAVTWTP